ncbi:MAG: metallophosphoesterase [Aquificaceae bacterium]|nr:metallophosphoesterase [Aquificaceae bacterium]
MRWFIPIFLLVFALMHLYIFWRFIIPAVRGTGLRVFSAGVLTLGFFLPFIWRYADNHMHPWVAYLTALLGLLWIGFLFYLFLFGLLLELYRGFVLISKSLLNVNPLPTPSPKASLLLILLLSLLLSAYSHYETLNLKVERFTLETEKLPPGVERIRILHISDLHLGPVMGMDKIELVRKVYERESPQLVVSTGDLVDGNMKDKLYLAQALSEINPPLGKYAVLGNHEYYRGVEQAVEFTERAGFRLLRGEIIYLREYNLAVVGIDDKDCRFFRKCKGTLSDENLLQKTERKNFVLYLKHRPELEEGSEELFDLMLSGHTHGGVYYPVGKLLLTRMFLGDRGLHKLGDAYIYISKGVGTGGPPMRLFSPPDVAVIDLLNRRR